MSTREVTTETCRCGKDLIRMHMHGQTTDLVIHKEPVKGEENQRRLFKDISSAKHCD